MRVAMVAIAIVASVHHITGMMLKTYEKEFE